MKLLIDMNLSPRWVAVLAEAGIEEVHWSSLGAHNTPDPVIMACASANDYVVLTHDLDFSAILAATHGEKPSGVASADFLRRCAASSYTARNQRPVALRITNG